MTIDGIRNMARRKYRIGQNVTLKLNDAERYGGDKVTVKIIDFLPEYVLTERKGCKECFRYLDFLKMSSEFKEESIGKGRGARHKSLSA